MEFSNHNCRDCVYFGGAFDEICCCNYIFMKHTRRPCPPGDACTVKIVRKKRRRMKSDKTKMDGPK